jgi:acetyl esterase/lipase
VHIHGGGFTGGQRDSVRDINICSNLARHGYVAMSIEYQLATRGKGSWPQNLRDCKTAIRWLRVNANRLNIDPERIGVIGGSAGATLAGLVALTEKSDGLDPQEPYSNVSCRVRCGVMLYGISDLAQWHDNAMLGKSISEDIALYKKASPVTYARADSPPMLLVHGTADETVNYHQSELLADALNKVGASPELVIIPNAVHSFHLQPPQRDLRPLVLGFFDKYLSPLPAHR